VVAKFRSLDAGPSTAGYRTEPIRCSSCCDSNGTDGDQPIRLREVLTIVPRKKSPPTLSSGASRSPVMMNNPSGRYRSSDTACMVRTAGPSGVQTERAGSMFVCTHGLAMASRFVAVYHVRSHAASIDNAGFA